MSSRLNGRTQFVRSPAVQSEPASLSNWRPGGELGAERPAETRLHCALERNGYFPSFVPERAPGVPAGFGYGLGIHRLELHDARHRFRSSQTIIVPRGERHQNRLAQTRLSIKLAKFVMTGT
jgi:hypothetical protein